ncbi:uncharacterized protein LOC142542044 [Primulina tabacum]|uniref:uncharacterized protein LOC142542044 n=1 Tax=Primulina tabacum TaxID=48773 RepID=UPI003F597FEB
MSQDPAQNNRENIPEDTSDLGEELFMTMVHNQHRATEFIQTSYGNAQRRRSINIERIAGHIQLVNDYFSSEPVYTDDMYRRRFRMRKELFLRIVTDLKNHLDGYFKWREDAARRKGLSPLQKCTAAIRQLAYGGPADQLDGYLRMGETTALECLSNFCQCVMQIYGRVYLRKPNAIDVARFLEIHEQRHGFPGMLGNLDCMHWAWKNCPVAWRAQYTRGDHGYPTILLEAVASADLWIWHAFFGVAGSRNDINVLNESPLLMTS